jgi:hypothetical protein
MQTSEDKIDVSAKTDLMSFFDQNGFLKTDNLRSIKQQLIERNETAFEATILKELQLVTIFTLSLCSTMSRDTVPAITRLALPDFPIVKGWLDDLGLRFLITELTLAEQQQVVMKYLDEKSLMTLYKKPSNTKEVLCFWSKHYVFAYLALIKIQATLKQLAPRYKLCETSDFTYEGNDARKRTSIAEKIYDARNTIPMDMMYMAKRHAPYFGHSISQMNSIIKEIDSKSIIVKKNLEETSRKQNTLDSLDRAAGFLNKLIGALEPLANFTRQVESKNETKQTEKKKKKILPVTRDTSIEESKSESKEIAKEKEKEKRKANKHSEPVFQISSLEPAGYNNLIYTRALAEKNLTILDSEIKTLSINFKALCDDKDVISEQKIRLDILGLKIKENITDSQTKIKNDFNHVDGENKKLITENTKALEAIREHIRQVISKINLYTNEINTETLKLYHTKPKEKKLTEAERKFRQAQEKKALEKKKQEEKAQEKSEKIQTTPKKPSTKPVQALQAAPKTPSTPKKSQEVKKSAAPTDPFAFARIMHLNEACKNLILINKMLTLFAEESLADEVLHYALLYNIFRCFQSLKMYQQCGGAKGSMNSDEVANLRHMIIHHGAANANSDSVKNFARQLQGNLPNVILKLKNRDLAQFELSEDLRQTLISEFHLVESGKDCPHSRLPVSSTPLYDKLARFHEDKVDNDDEKSIAESVFENYIPMMRNLLAQLDKVSSTEWHIYTNNYVEMFFF